MRGRVSFARPPVTVCTRSTMCPSHTCLIMSLLKHLMLLHLMVKRICKLFRSDELIIHWLGWELVALMDLKLILLSHQVNSNTKYRHKLVVSNKINPDVMQLEAGRQSIIYFPGNHHTRGNNSIRTWHVQCWIGQNHALFLLSRINLIRQSRTCNQKCTKKVGQDPKD